MAENNGEVKELTLAESQEIMIDGSSNDEGAKHTSSAANEGIDNGIALENDTPKKTFGVGSFHDHFMLLTPSSTVCF